jgi:hypothetical protein
VLIRNELEGARPVCPVSRMDSRMQCPVDGAPVASDADAASARSPSG